MRLLRGVLLTAVMVVGVASPASASSAIARPGARVRIICQSSAGARISADQKWVTCPGGRQYRAAPGRIFIAAGGQIIEVDGGIGNGPAKTLQLPLLNKVLSVGAGPFYPPDRPTPPKPHRIFMYYTRERTPEGWLRVCAHYFDNDPPDCVEYPPADPPPPTADPAKIIANLRNLGYAI